MTVANKFHFILRMTWIDSFFTDSRLPSSAIICTNVSVNHKILFILEKILLLYILTKFCAATETLSSSSLYSIASEGRVLSFATPCGVPSLFSLRWIKTENGNQIFIMMIDIEKNKKMIIIILLLLLSK